MKKILRPIYTLLVKIRAKTVGEDLHVNGLSTVSNTTVLGKNVNFNGISIRGKGIVKIGDNFHSGKDIVIISQNHNYDDGTSIPYDDTVIRKDIIIEDNVWIGDKVTVLPGVTIGDNAIIGSNSVVTNDNITSNKGSMSDFDIVTDNCRTTYHCSSFNNRSFS